jgi:DNA-binding CsgD family transcriptional regulator
MRSSLDIVKSRSSPGILIFDANNRLVYSNQAALEYFPGLRRGKVSPEILGLCLSLKGQTRPQSRQKESAHCLVIDSISDFPFSLRAFPVTERRPGKTENFVMILVEKIVDRHLAELDFDKLRHDYGLTKREKEVLELISQGLSNLEISRKLFISEYTVKDHIKKILSKMNLGSRSGIIASLLQPRGKGS